MARRIMDVIQQNLDPTSVSNVLYELMVDWRGYVMEATIIDSKNGNRMLRSRRRWTESMLGKFLGVSDKEMREMLEQHFGVSVADSVRPR